MTKVALACPRRADVYGDFVTVAEHLVKRRDDNVTYNMLDNRFSVLGRDALEYDAIIVLGTYAGFLLPYLSRSRKPRIISVFDRVGKTGVKNRTVTQMLGSWLERKAVEYADTVVATNGYIREYLYDNYDVTAELIGLGGDGALRKVSQWNETEHLYMHGLTPDSYLLMECRNAEKEHLSVVLKGFANALDNIVIVGDWDNDDVGRNLIHDYAGLPNFKFIKAPLKDDLLYSLRKNSSLLIYGHDSSGSDLPLVEMMRIGRPLLCYDCACNRAVTRNQAAYFTSPEDLMRLLFLKRDNAESLKAIADVNYSWKRIFRQYDALCR